MKNATQPQHTQGELEQLGGASATKRILDDKHWIDIIVNGKGIVSSAYGKTREETEANAKRIVKAVNMHDELMQSVNDLDDMIKKLYVEYIGLEKLTSDDLKNMQTITDKSRQLLKQAGEEQQPVQLVKTEIEKLKIEIEELKGQATVSRRMGWFSVEERQLVLIKEKEELLQAEQK